MRTMTSECQGDLIQTGPFPTGWPAGADIYFRCVLCGGTVPSLPPDSVSCSCGNVRIDIDYGRAAADREDMVQVLRIAG